MRLWRLFGPLALVLDHNESRSQGRQTLTQNEARLGRGPCILCGFATAINQCISCESACTSGNSYLLFYHRRQSPRSQMTVLLVPRFLRSQIYKAIFS